MPFSTQNSFALPALRRTAHIGLATIANDCLEGLARVSDVGVVVDVLILRNRSCEHGTIAAGPTAIKTRRGSIKMGLMAIIGSIAGHIAGI